MGVLPKGVFIDLRAHNFVHAVTSLCASCMHACHHAHNLLSPAGNKLYLHKKRKSLLITNINHNLGDCWGGDSL